MTCVVQHQDKAIDEDTKHDRQVNRREPPTKDARYKEGGSKWDDGEAGRYRESQERNVALVLEEDARKALECAGLFCRDKVGVGRHDRNCHGRG